MIILTNFKAYPTGVFQKAKELVQTHIDAQNEVQKTRKDVQFAVAINSLDLQSICSEFAEKIDIYAQHCDNASFGSSTGKILPEMLKEMGAKGVILHHSENRFSTDNNYETLISTINFAKKSGLTVVCCAETTEEGKFLSDNSNADFIAVEPPKLIGGNISVSASRPELISESVEQIGAHKVLIGAGIKTGRDVKIAIEKGSVGVLLASGVTKSTTPKKVLLDLAS
ncbi:TPA: triose-phosphate isomerase [Candidatus Gracilibacteria bacterium]|nr:triose-phosphate isomerase [Candidatus Peregrinibacteria bacterium]HIQ56812.1 triose-phosphate isomerase [Candidatus Gracilibacteria bacterium]HIQ57159.1 triose-phosphate isomerase [Candidatus Gracilibacteria bacterium]